MFAAWTRRSVWIGLAVLAAAGAPPARAAAPRSSPDAAAVYRDAANLQNHGAYDAAAAEWTSLLEQFPDDPLAAQARYYLAVCRMELGQLREAADGFRAVLAAAPDFELADEARLHLGWCQYMLANQAERPEGYAEAAKTLEELLEQSPKTARGDEAWYFLGEVRLAQRRYEEAAAAFGRAAAWTPPSPLRGDALFAQAAAWEQLGRAADAAEAYAGYVREFADGPLADAARIRAAEMTLQSLLAADGASPPKEPARWEELGRRFARLAERPGFPEADLALMRQAFIAARLGREEEAARLYAAAAERFPDSPETASAALAAGRSWRRAGRLEEAERWLRRALDRGGAEGAEAAHWLCRLLLERGAAEAALAAARRGAALAGKGAWSGQLALDQADALAAAPGRSEEAAARYEQVAARNPEDPLAAHAWYGAAAELLELGRWREARRAARQLLDRFPNHELAAGARAAIAEAWLQEGEYEQAAEAFGELVRQAENSAEADRWRLRAGWALYLGRRWDDAVAELAPAAERLKDGRLLAEARYLIGACRFAAGDYESAASELRASLAADGTWERADRALLLLARSLSRLDRTDEAREALELLGASFPGSAVAGEALYELGRCLEQAGRTDDAAAAYLRAAARGGEAVAPFAQLAAARLRLEQRDWAGAEAAYAELIRRWPDHELAAEALLGRGLARRRAGRAAEAAQDVAAALQRDLPAPRRREAQYELARAWLDQGDAAKAAELLDKLLGERPAFPAADRALHALAEARRRLGQPEAAAAALRRLAADFPQSPLAAEALFSLAELLGEQNQWDAAQKTFAACRRKADDPELARNAAYRQAWALLELGRRADAADTFAAAAEGDDPIAADSRLMQAECLFQMGRHEAALAAYREAKRMWDRLGTLDAQRRAHLLVHAAQCATRLEQWQAALELLKPLTAGEAGPLLAEAWCEQGWALQHLDQEAAALAAYEQAARRSRGEAGARARFLIGELRFLEGRHADALREFQRVVYGYGGQDSPPEVKPWQARAALEAGRCAEILMGQAADAAARHRYLAVARQAYEDLVTRHGSSELARRAAERLRALAPLDARRP